MSETAVRPYQVVTIDGVDCVTIKQSAAYLGISVTAVHYKLRARGQQNALAHKELDGRLLVTVEALEAEKLRLAGAQASEATTAA